CHDCGAHLEGGEQARAKDAVAQAPNLVLPAQFNRRSPECEFTIADQTVEPAFGTQAGSNVAADSARTKVKRERLTRWTPGGDLLRLANRAVPHLFEILTDDLLREKWQNLQDGRSRKISDIQPQAAKEASIVRRVDRRFHEFTEPEVANTLQFIGRQPLI